MKGSRIAAAVVLIAAVGLLLLPRARILLRDLTAYAAAATPHDRYSAALRLRGYADTPAGRSWTAAAQGAIEGPVDARIPMSFTGTFGAAAPQAFSWRFAARRGHLLVVQVDFRGGPAVFIDVFSRSGERLASAPQGGQQLTYEVEADDGLVVRIQPELGVAGAFSLEQRLDPSMGFPVQGLTPRAVQSMFGASRDAGRRRHEGIDIFAPRGTPVLAAIDGWVGNSLSNGLGGNVVWVWSPTRGLSTYYAHLDRHAVAPGERVATGTVVGYVGSTGNARGGPPHLHFGVYVSGEGSVDPLPFVCAAPCGFGRFVTLAK